MSTKTIGQVLEKLKSFDPEKQVRFAFCMLSPTKLMSYRGYYDQAAIGFDDNKTMTVADMINDLEQAIDGRTFTNFYADMGDRPEGMTIERINNNKGYSPDNCKWSTRKEQNRNMRTTRIIEFDGISMCITDWAERLGINRTTLHNRLKKHPIHIALMEKSPRVVP